MITALCFLIFPLSFLSFGHLCLPHIRLSEKSNADAVMTISKFSLGLIIYSYYWFLMGTFGALNLSTLCVYLTASLIAIFAARSFLFQSLKTIWQSAHTTWQNSQWGKVALTLLVISLSATFIRCWSFYIEGDSLVYHLFLPKQFVLHGGFWKVPYTEHLFWPLFSEVCFIPGEILKSLALSKFITFQVFAAFCLLAGILTKTLTGNNLIAIIASLTLATSPAFFFHAPSTYNDIYFSYFLMLSLSLLWLKNDSPDRQSAIHGLSGLFLGAAMANKYTALYGAIAVIPILLGSLVSQKNSKTMIRLFLFFCFGAIISGVPYYVRSFIQYGNPVFPFAQSIFNTPFGHGLTQAGLVGSNVSGFNAGTGRGLVDFLLLIPNLTFHPQAFGGDKIGFIFLILLPFCLLSFKKYWGAAVYMLIYAFIWFSLSQYNRYLLPALAVLLILACAGIAPILSKSKIFRVTALTLLLSLITIHTAWTIYHAHKDFLKRAPESIIPIAEWLNEIIKSPNQKVMTIEDERLYYYDFAAFRESTFRNFTLYPDFKDPLETLHLLDEEKVTYVLVADHPGEPSNQAFQPVQYFSQFVESGYYTSIGQQRSADQTLYTIYKRALHESPA